VTPFTVKVVVVIVSGSMASLKVAVIFVFLDTPVAASTGTVRVTVGEMMSRVAPVVNFQTSYLPVRCRSCPWPGGNRGGILGAEGKIACWCEGCNDAE